MSADIDLSKILGLLDKWGDGFPSKEFASAAASESKRFTPNTQYLAHTQAGVPSSALPYPAASPRRW